jgi:hypothetical protein
MQKQTAAQEELVGSSYDQILPKRQLTFRLEVRLSVLRIAVYSMQMYSTTDSNQKQHNFQKKVASGGGEKGNVDLQFRGGGVARAKKNPKNSVFLILFIQKVCFLTF